MLAGWATNTLGVSGLIFQMMRVVLLLLDLRDSIFISSFVYARRFPGVLRSRAGLSANDLQRIKYSASNLDQTSAAPIFPGRKFNPYTNSNHFVSKLLLKNHQIGDTLLK